MKNKKIIIAICLLIVMISLGVWLYFSQYKKNATYQEKIIDFNQYELLADGALTSTQSGITSDIIKKTENGNYTINDPFIVINPYGISPLTAIISFKTSEKEQVKITVKAKAGGKDLVYTSEAATSHYLPVYGLYLDYENEVLIETKSATKNILLPTEKPNNMQPVYLLDREVKTNNLDTKDNDFYFLSTLMGSIALAYDQEGELRWFLTSGIYKQITTLSNGHFLLANINDSTLIEIDILGKIYNSYELNNPYLENYLELPSENIIYATDNAKLIELDLKTGKAVKTYEIFKILSKVDANHMNNIKEKFGEITSLTYDAKNKAVIVGIHNYSTILSLDYKTSKINWILANPTYYSDKYTDYLLKPTGNDFTYPIGNYNAKMKDNLLSVFVNDWDLTKTYACSNADTAHSYAVDYLIDSSKKTVSEKWSYGKDLNNFSFLYADYMSKNNEKTILFGREFFNFRAPMQECSLYDEGDFNAKIVTLKDDQITFEMTINNSYNTVNKMNIYNQVTNFTNHKVNAFSANQKVDKHETANYQTKYSEASIFTVPLTLVGNTLSLLINNDNKAQYKIILVDEYGKGYIYMANAENKINFKKGLGKTIILIEKDGILSNTGYYLDL